MPGFEVTSDSYDSYGSGGPRACLASKLPGIPVIPMALGGPRAGPASKLLVIPMIPMALQGVLMLARPRSYQ